MKNKLKKYTIFSLMILISLPDVVWGLYNLILGGTIFGIGKILKD